ncbi:unnamed protein product, partial [Ectocarpus sp. 13 AM-2016]
LDGVRDNPPHRSRDPCPLEDVYVHGGECILLSFLDRLVPHSCLLLPCPRSNFVETLSFLLLLLRPCAGTLYRLSNCFGARFTRAPATRLFGWTLFAGANAIG